MSYKLHFLGVQPQRRALSRSSVFAYGREIVDRTDAAYPHLLRANNERSCGEFTQRVLRALPPSEQWGHLSKRDGEAGYTFPNGTRVSYDVICHRATGRQVDIIGGSIAPRPGGTAWIEIDPSVYRPHNVWTPPFAQIFDSGTGSQAGTAAAQMYFGYFPLMTALRLWPEEGMFNFNWIERECNPDGYRVFLDVEGQSHIRGGKPDPWRDAGVDGTKPEWEADLRRMLNLVGGRGKKVYATVYGGRNHFPSEDSRRRFHDRIVQGIARENLWGAVRGFHMMNEFRVNYWEASEVRAAGRDMRSKIPAGIHLSLSSPHLAHSYVSTGGTTQREPTQEEMVESFEELYGGADHAGADEIAIHVMRERTSKWSDPFGFNNIMPNLPKINHEGFGVGASGGGSTADVAALTRDYKRTGDAAWPVYVPHMAWCVFNGHLPAEYAEPDDVRLVSDTRSIVPMVAAWKAIRTGTTPPIPSTGEPGDVDMAKLPGRKQIIEAIDWLHEFYGSKDGLQRPEGLYRDGKPDTEGIGVWIFDVYLHAILENKTDAEARAEVRRGIESSDEWKKKHGK